MPGVVPQLYGRLGIEEIKGALAAPGLPGELRRGRSILESRRLFRRGAFWNASHETAQKLIGRILAGLAVPMVL